MRIRVASDLHVEQLGWDAWSDLVDTFSGNDADVLVLAGDVTSLKYLDQARHVLGALCQKYGHVVFVPGNHEYYGTSIRDAQGVLSVLQTEIHNLRVLKNSYLHLDGQRFYGGSLWFPDDPQHALYKDMMNDFRLIDGIEPFCYIQNGDFRQWAKSMVDDETVVVSHHLPTPASIHPKYAGSQLNRFFLSDCSDLIDELKPKVWIHGHTHDSFDYVRGSTRVVCNPYGYNGSNRDYKVLLLDI